LGNSFLDLGDGNDPKLKTRSGFQIGVRIVVPPLPFDDDETFDSFSKNSVIVCKKPPLDEIRIEDVKQVNGQWLVAETSGVILIFGGMGLTMRQAQSQVYSRIKKCADPQYVLPHGYRGPSGGRHRSSAHLGLFAVVLRDAKFQRKSKRAVKLICFRELSRSEASPLALSRYNR
jgi:hypothetical protein